MMKKFIKKMMGVLAAFLMIFTLVGCDKSGSIKKAFEKEGYTVSSVTTKDNSTVKTLLSAILTEDQQKEIDKYEIIFCTKNLISTAVIIKFPSTNALKGFLTVETEDGKKDTSIYDSAKENSLINNNCWYAAGTAGKDIFKKA